MVEKEIEKSINHTKYSQSNVVMVFRVLDKLGVETEDFSDIIVAIGNRDEGTDVLISHIPQHEFLQVNQLCKEIVCAIEIFQFLVFMIVLIILKFYFSSECYLRSWQ